MQETVDFFVSRALHEIKNKLDPEQRLSELPYTSIFLQMKGPLAERAFDVLLNVSIAHLPYTVVILNHCTRFYLPIVQARMTNAPETPRDV